MEVDHLTAEQIVTRSMKIAGDLCIYTNHHTVLEVIEKTSEETFKPTIGYWNVRGKCA